MNDLFLKNLFLFVRLTSYGWEGRHMSEKYSAITNQTQTVNPSKSAKEKQIDTKKFIIRWKETKMMRTGKHEGTLKLKEGILLFKNDKLTGGYFMADMNSIEITDIPVHETIAIRNLTTHLKSDYNKQKYLESKFEITNVQYTNDTLLKINGNMTIKDVTKNISIPVHLKN